MRTDSQFFIAVVISIPLGLLVILYHTFVHIAISLSRGVGT